MSRTAAKLGVRVMIAAILASVSSAAVAFAAPPSPDPAFGSASLRDRPIIVGINEDFPPWEFLNDRGEPDGYDADLIRAVAEVMDLKLEFRSDTWSEMREALQRGEIDVLAGMLISDARRKEVDFSTPHMLVRYSIFVRRGFDVPPDLGALRGKKTLVERGSLMHDELLRKGFSVSDLVTVNSEPDALRGLAEGAADYAVLPYWQGMQLIREHDLKIDSSGETPVHIGELAFATQVGNDELITALNTGLAILDETGAYDAVYDQWFGEPDSLTLGRAALLSLWVVIPSALLIGGILLWSRTLRRTVQQQTAELRNSERRMEAIIHSMPVLVGALDEQGNIALWNRECERVSGYSAQEIVGNPHAMKMLYPDDEYREKMLREWTAFAGTYRGHNWIMTTRDGSRRTISWSDISRDFPIPGWSGWGVGIDITEQAKTEAALHEHQRMLSGIMSNLPGAVYRCLNDRDWTMVFLSDGVEALTGFTPTEITSGAASFGERIIHEDDRAHVWDDVQKALAERRPFQLVYRIVTKSGQEKWAWEQGSGVFNESNELEALEGIIIDITAQKHAEFALRDSELRYRTLFENAPIGIGVADEQGNLLAFNDAMLTPGGYTRQQIKKVGNVARLYADINQRNQALAKLRERGFLRQEEVQFLRVDGTVYDALLSLTPIEINGNPCRLAIVEDITERKRSEERQRLLMQELDHRVKNNLAAVLALAKQTIDSSDSLKQFASAFTGRVWAMARTHEALAHAQWQGIRVREIAQVTLGVYMDQRPNRVCIEGEPVTLPATAALPLALTLHELATNAAKYGALSNLDGTVSLSWSVQNGTIQLDWVESDGPRVASPTQTGTGARLIEGFIRHELGGSVQIEFNPNGLRCKMTIPMTLDRTPGPNGDIIEPVDGP